MNAKELDCLLRECAADRERCLQLGYEIANREPTFPSSEWFAWRREQHENFAAQHIAFTLANDLLAAFLGGKVRSVPCGGRNPDLDGGMRLDHHVYVAAGGTTVAAITQPYGFNDVVEARGRGGVVARRLDLPSWWNEPARVFVIMREDAPQWDRLTPLLAKETQS